MSSREMRRSSPMLGLIRNIGSPIDKGKLIFLNAEVRSVDYVFILHAFEVKDLLVSCKPDTVG
jgi:hypothetical protein